MTPDRHRLAQIAAELDLRGMHIMANDVRAMADAADTIDRLRQRVADLERLLCIERAAEDDRPF